MNQNVYQDSCSIRMCIMSHINVYQESYTSLESAIWMCVKECVSRIIRMCIKIHIYHQIVYQKWCACVSRVATIIRMCITSDMNQESYESCHVHVYLSSECVSRVIWIKSHMNNVMCMCIYYQNVYQESYESWGINDIFHSNWLPQRIRRNKKARLLGTNSNQTTISIELVLCDTGNFSLVSCWMSTYTYICIMVDDKHQNDSS